MPLFSILTSLSGLMPNASPNVVISCQTEAERSRALQVNNWTFSGHCASVSPPRQGAEHAHMHGQPVMWPTMLSVVVKHPTAYSHMPSGTGIGQPNSPLAATDGVSAIIPAASSCGTMLSPGLRHNPQAGSQAAHAPDASAGRREPLGGPLVFSPVMTPAPPGVQHIVWGQNSSGS